MRLHLVPLILPLPVHPQVTSRVVFPLALDMAPFLRPRLVQKQTEDGAEADPASGVAAEGGDAATAAALMYDLFAVVVHEGGSGGGHYHSYFRDMIITVRTLD
jgi:hypothetical protein